MKEKTIFYLMIACLVILSGCAATNPAVDDVYGKSNGNGGNSKLLPPMKLIPFSEDIILRHPNGLDSIQCFIRDSIVLSRQHTVRKEKIIKGVLTPFDSSYVEYIRIPPYPDPKSQCQFIPISGGLYNFSFWENDNEHTLPFGLNQNKNLTLCTYKDTIYSSAKTLNGKKIISRVDEYEYYGEKRIENKWWVEKSSDLYCSLDIKAGTK